MLRVSLIAATALAAVPATASAQTVYSSLPMQGASRVQTAAVVAGARLALTDAGSPIKYVPLDDSTRRAANWTPERASQNARRAAQDQTTIGVIGAFNSGASAVMVPILNEAGIPVVSPSNTAIGLTRDGPGAIPGEPDKYYPTGKRNYFRLTPNDSVQGGALAQAMKDAGCRRIGSAHDKEIYGDGVSAWVRRYAKRLSLRVVATRATDPGHGFAAAAGAFKHARADCVVYSGITANGAPRLLSTIGRALPKARFFASDGVAESFFAREVSRSVARRITITLDTLAPSAYPAAQAVLARAGANPDPYFLYGYEAMRLYTDALAAVGPSTTAITHWLQTSVKNRQSVLGTYSFDRNGDTTIKDFGLYRIRDGALTFTGVVRAP
jgi:branched-chain amino acid transport system substrate-binding protein